MIALMGAAGNVGGKVADLLLQQDQDCACSSTADAAFVLLPDNLDAPDFVANRSRMSQAITYPLGETGVGHVVALTEVGADREGAPGPPGGLHDHERRLSGVEGVNLFLLRPEEAARRRARPGWAPRT